MAVVLRKLQAIAQALWLLHITSAAAHWHQQHLITLGLSDK